VRELERDGAVKGSAYCLCSTRTPEVHQNFLQPRIRPRRATGGGFFVLGQSPERIAGGNGWHNDDLHWNSARDYRNLDRRVPGRVHPGSVLITLKRSRRVQSYCSGIGCGRGGMCADGNGDLIVYLRMTPLARAWRTGAMQAMKLQPLLTSPRDFALALVAFFRCRQIHR